MEQLEVMADRMKLLADKTRLSILALLQVRELCVCEIVELMDTTQPNISQHLRKLKAAGLVSESRRGQWVYYSLSLEDKPYIQSVLDYVPSAEKIINSVKLNCVTDECCE